MNVTFKLPSEELEKNFTRHAISISDDVGGNNFNCVAWCNRSLQPMVDVPMRYHRGVSSTYEFSTGIGVSVRPTDLYRRICCKEEIE